MLFVKTNDSIFLYKNSKAQIGKNENGTML